MKIKFKLFLTILVVMLGFTLVSCVDDHVHQFSNDWSHNEEYHWHQATCEHTNEVSEKEAHTLVDGKCSKCGYDTKLKTGITFTQEVLTVNVGEVVNLLEGVTVMDSKGNEVECEVYTQMPLDEEGRATQSGQYRVKYVAIIEGLTYTEYRNVVVVYIPPQTDDLIINGDFETGSTDPFTKSEFENGGGQLSIVTGDDGNKYLKLEITSVAFSQGSPRVETNKFELDMNKFYEIQFTAWADTARTAHIQVGELLPANPWYNQIGSGDWYANLTTEAQDFKFRFQPAADSPANMANAQLLFEFGTMENGQSAVTNCYLDNIQIVEVEDLGIESLLNMAELNFPGEGEAVQDENFAKANPNTAVIWFDQGGWCGAPAVVNATLEDKVLTVNAKQPEGACWFATQIFVYTPELPTGNYKLTFNLNVSKACQVTICGEVMDLVEGDNQITIEKQHNEGQIGLVIQLGQKEAVNSGDMTVKVSKVLLVSSPVETPIDYADPNNLFGNYTEVMFGEEATSKKEPNKFFIWHVKSAEWGCGPAVTTSFELVNGVLKVNTNQTAEHWWFATQVFYTTLPFENAGDHKLTFTLVSNVAGEVTICGQKMAIKEGKNEIEVAFSVAKGASFTFSMQFGWLEGADVSHTLAGNINAELSDFAIDGQKQDDTPVVEKKPLEKTVGIVLNSVSEGTTIAFAAVANAVSYKVYVYNGEELVYTQEVTNGGMLNYTTPGTYTVKVQAIADGKEYTDSELSDPVNWVIAGADDEIQLGKVVGIVLNPAGEGTVVAFAAVANAVSYKVYVYNGEELVYTQEVTNGGMLNYTTPGTYTVKVQALGNGSNIKDSELSDPVNWVIAGADDEIQLGKVVGIVLNPIAEGTVVAFAAVANAVSYKVYVYNGEELVYTQEVTNGGFINYTTPGTYTVKVQALGNGSNIKDSELSDPVNWTL